MTSARWWDVAVIGGVATTTVILVLNGVGAVDRPRLVGGAIVLALYLVAWFVLGRQLVGDPHAAAARPVDRRIIPIAYREAGYIAVIAILAGTAALVHPALAILQAVTYPIVWTLSSSLRRAIVGNAAVALLVGAGYAFSFGFDIDSLTEAAIVVVLSLAFSLAMGFWISRMFDVSAERQRLLDELTAAQHTLAALSRDAGVTSERERLAREIHDTIAQDLTGLVLLTQQARRMLQSDDPDGADLQLALLEDSARLALTETRALVATSSRLTPMSKPRLIEPPKLCCCVALKRDSPTCANTRARAPLSCPSP